MPLRIAFVASITIAACLVVPVTVSAVAGPGGASASESIDDPDPGESVPIGKPTGVHRTDDSAVGVPTNIRPSTKIATAGYGSPQPSTRSSVGLIFLIVVGLLPSLLMMMRSSHRRRTASMDIP